MCLIEEIFSKVGIPKERWDWLTGEAVRKDTNFYPLLPGYGRFLDPPFYIDGNPVRGGPGWFVISALDLARLGLLFAWDGEWDGAKLVPHIRESDRKSGQDNTNRVAGYGHTKGVNAFVSLGYIATGDIEPEEKLVLSWIEGPVLKKPGASSGKCC